MGCRLDAGLGLILDSGSAKNSRLLGGLGLWRLGREWLPKKALFGGLVNATGNAHRGLANANLLFSRGSANMFVADIPDVSPIFMLLDYMFNYCYDTFSNSMIC